jgi:hypothetical protein
VTRTVDCGYTITEERLREYAKVPEIERLRWLDELVRFTLMWRAAPTILAPDASPLPDPGERGPECR